MKTSITKMNNDTFIVIQETTLQSIVSDIFSILVLLAAFGANIAFSLLVCHSFILDVFVVFIICLYFFSEGRKKQKKILSKEQIEEINKIISNAKIN